MELGFSTEESLIISERPKASRNKRQNNNDLEHRYKNDQSQSKDRSISTQIY
jgi:hypothetical protein